MDESRLRAGREHSAVADEFLWLEDRHGGPALAWVHRQNARTEAELKGDTDYQSFFETAFELMTAEDNIAVGYALRGHVYNFWQDKTNPLGLWRRTSIPSYKTDKPVWETIIDFDPGRGRGSEVGLERRQPAVPGLLALPDQAVP